MIAADSSPFGWFREALSIKLRIQRAISTRCFLGTGFVSTWQTGQPQRLSNRARSAFHFVLWCSFRASGEGDSLKSVFWLHLSNVMRFSSRIIGDPFADLMPILEMARLRFRSVFTELFPIACRGPILQMANGPDTPIFMVLFVQFRFVAHVISTRQYG